VSTKTSKTASATTADAIEDGVERRPSALAAYYELTKPRLSLLSIITALVGYLAAMPERNLSVLINFLIGTGLCAAGAAALNQWWERSEDGLMTRTKERPLPAKLLEPGNALAFGILLSVIGVVQLALGTNALAAALGAATILSYVVIYTPMKKMTRWATEVGAISGALPPLIGWAAAEGQISSLGWTLFGILAFWQIPHFMAIAWSFRKDYAVAGYIMLSVIDPQGGKVARWSFVNAICLLIVSFIPIALQQTSWIYAACSLIFGAWFLKKAYDFLSPDDRDATARKLFFNSIIYLPAVLFSLVIDRWILS